MHRLLHLLPSRILLALLRIRFNYPLCLDVIILRITHTLILIRLSTNMLLLETHHNIHQHTFRQMVNPRTQSLLCSLPSHPIGSQSFQWTLFLRFVSIMQEVLQILLLRKLDQNTQLVHDLVLELCDKESFGESPEFGKLKDVGIAVFGVEINLLNVKPVDQEAKTIKVDVKQSHGFGGAFGEIAVEGIEEERRVVADEVFVDDEGFIRIFRANDDCDHALRASDDLLAILRLAT
jgi:hypothetical protein